MNVPYSRSLRVRIGFLALALAALLPAGRASAATCLFTFEGLPSPGAYGSNYSVLVRFVYTWTHELDRPKDGASVLFFEYDPSGNYTYGTDNLPAPATAGNASGTWSGNAFFSKVKLSNASANDTDSTLETRARFTVHAPSVDKDYSSPFVNVDLVPGAPSMINVPASTADGDLTVYWGKADGAVYHEVQRKANSLGIWSTREQSFGSSFDDTVTPGHRYFYRVRGVNGVNKGVWKTDTTGCLYPVGKPATIAAPGTDSDGTYTITWGAAAGANRYELAEQAEGSAFWLNVYSGTALSKTQTGKTPGKVYYYRVRGANSVSGLKSDWVTCANGVYIQQAGALAFEKVTFGVVEGTSFATLNVVRTNGAEGAASVNFKTADKTALAGQDYKSKTGTLTWGNGDAAPKTIQVTIVNDTVTEPKELFKVILSNATGAKLGYPRVAKVAIAANTKSAPAGDGLDAAIPEKGLETVVEGPGTLAFSWKLDTDDPGDTLVVTDNGEVLDAVSGPVDWERLSVTLGEGAHAIRWTVAGSDESEPPSGAGRLDDVLWSPE